jgi:hypothetical protein
MKKTLLIAAAALVAGVISSEAQVYSANIVGYVNQVFTNGVLELVSNPMDNGTNTANDVLAGLPNTSSIQLWNGSGFVVYTKTSAGFTQGGVANNPPLPVGQGFFVKAKTLYTNTYVGNVVPSPGGQSSIGLTNGILELVGSVLPVGGNFNDVGTNTLNLIATLPNTSSIQLWNGSTFVVYTKTSAGFTQGGVPSNPPYTAALGFFVKAKTATNWVQNLSN